MSQPEYVFENGKVYTMVDGQVVSSVHEADFQDPAAQGGGGMQGGDTTPMPDPPADIQPDLGMGGASCPNCQTPTEQGDQFCSQCGSDVSGGGPGLNDFDGPPGAYTPGINADEGHPQGHHPLSATTVTTPNGLKGTVLGRTANLWADEVTVRFENGRIVRLPVSDALTFSTAKTASAPTNSVDALEARLHASIDGTRDSLKTRLTELDKIQREAGQRTAKADYAGQVKLDSIRTQAKAEITDVKAAIAHLDEVEAMEAPVAPFRMQAVEQEAYGGADGSWLDHTVQDMIDEAESTDYEKLMDEGPEAFVAALDINALASAGITRTQASDFIQTKTAAAEPDLRARYEGVWLQRVEDVRQAELVKHKTATHKEVAAEPDHSNLPDDVLFT